MTSPVAPESTRSAPVDSPLPRTMGLFALVIYGVGDMLGAGIYGLVGKAADKLGNMVWLAFAVSMLAAIFTGLSYASLGSRYPRAAGAAFIVGRAFGNRALAYVVGLVVLSSGLTSLAAASRVAAGYFGAFVPSAPTLVVALGFVLLLALVTFRGMRESTWLNVVCTTIEVSGLLFIVVVGARYLGGIDYFDARSTSNPSGELDTGVLLPAGILTFYAFVGFEDMLNVTEEVKDVRRNFPIGLVTAVLVTTFVYILISLVAVSVVPHAELAASERPLVLVASRAAPWLPTQVYTGVAIFAVMNTALLNFVMGSRLVYGMARQGLLPPILGRLHASRRTPHLAVLVLSGIVVALVLAGDIGSLARATSLLILVVFVVVNAALIVLQRRRGEEKGALEIPWVIPLVGIGVCLALIAGAKRAEILIAGALVLGAITTYFFVRPKRESVDEPANPGAG